MGPYKILKEFNYESYQDRMVRVICPFFNHFPNKPRFLRVCSTSLLKTRWKKEKLLVTINFSFPTAFSTLLDNLLPILSNLTLSSAKSLSLKESKICRLGKG